MQAWNNMAHYAVNLVILSNVLRNRILYCYVLAYFDLPSVQF